MNDARGGSDSGAVPEEQPGWGIRVLDGERPWGSIDIRPGEYGTVRYKLVVFPPGVTGVERRLLRLSQAWPAWGAVLWLMSEIGLSSALRPWAAFGISTMAYLGIEAVLIGAVGAIRPQVRKLSVELISGFTDRRTAAIYAEINALVNTLTKADVMRAQGRLRAIDHEAAWWQVYDRLGPGRPEPIENRPST